MISLLGAFCTVMTLLGFYLNARMSKWGFYSWIIGDVGWILYAILTFTFPHAIQCFVIILLNIYGLKTWKKNEKQIREAARG